MCLLLSMPTVVILKIIILIKVQKNSNIPIYPTTRHQLLPPVKYTHYNLQQRSHSLTLPSEDNNLIRKNFLHRMLFRDIY